MFPIFLSQWMKEKRNPVLLLLFVGLSIMATLLFGGSMNGKMRIDVFGEAGALSKSEAAWLGLLNRSESFVFRPEDEQTARKKVREGRADLAVKLTGDDYRIVASVEGPNVGLADQYLRTVYERELRLRAAAETPEEAERLRESIAAFLERPPFSLLTTAPDGSELTRYNMSLQLLFGFALFLAMLTMGFKINAITKDKTSGMWNRLILSPVRKTEMYAGYLLYGTLIGIVQIVLVLLVFRFVFGVDLGNRYDLLLLIVVLYAASSVAMCILLAGVLRTPEQFMMLFPAIVPLMPLVSGAYMPPGTITNEILLGVSEAVPLSHAMKALTDVAIYGAGFADLWIPIAKLLLIGVLCMGIGINLMERRTA